MPWEPRGKLVSKLREHKPDYLMVHVDDADEPQRVNVPNVRNRAQRVLRTLGEITWTIVEFFDRKGGLLAKHIRGAEDEAPPGDVEHLAPSREVATSHAMLGVMLRAQESVLVRFTAMLEPLLNQVYRCHELVARRLDLTEKQYEHALKVNTSMADDLIRAQAQLVAAHVGAGGDEEGQAGGMITSMLPAFMRAALAPDDAAANDKGRGKRPRPHQRAKKKASAGGGPSTREAPAPASPSTPRPAPSGATAPRNA